MEPLIREVPSAVGERLRISEIFLSLQGESTLVGLPTVFVRLTGCPLRCQYCDSEYAFRGGQVMEANAVVARVAAYQVGHVTVTGGEPLVRKELPEIVRRLDALPGIRDLSLSTNASRMASFAGELKAAGITRLNVSLDSLDPDRFKQITGGDLRRVVTGIEAAQRAGFAPIGEVPGREIVFGVVGRFWKLTGDLDSGGEFETVQIRCEDKSIVNRIEIVH